MATPATAPLVSILRRTAPLITRRFSSPQSNRGIIRYQRSIYSKRATIVTVTQTKASDGSTDNADTVAQPQVAIFNSSSADKSHTEKLDPSGIVVTASCAERIRELASKRSDAASVYLRVYVDAGGCSGFQYKFELESEESEDEEQGIDEEEDVVFEKDGSRVVIDQSSLELIKGSTVDFVREMIRSSFAVVGNPQSESACGCGSSFAVKNFEANPALD